MPRQKCFQENRPGKRGKNWFTSLSNIICQKFAFTNFGEKIFLMIGIILAAVSGACLPLIVLLFADLVTIFIQYQLEKEAKDEHSYFQDFWANHLRFTFVKQDSFIFDSKNLGDVIELYAMETAFLGVIIFFLTCSYVYLFNYVAEKQMTRLKVRYLSAVLKQPVDQTVTYEVFVKAHRNLQHFSASIGDNFGTLILSFSVFVTSLAIAFLNHIILTSMLVILFVLLAIILFFSVVIYSYLTDAEKNHYQIAENLAKDIFYNIHAVKAYEGESIEIRRFDKLLVTSQSAGVKTWMFFGFVIGLLYILLYTSYALTFWQGMSMALELKNKNETPDILIVVNFCMQICFVNFLKIPIFLIISKQSTLAFEEMKRVIYSTEQENNLKKTETQLVNDITFTSVYFSYSADEKSLLNNINVRIPFYTLTCVVGDPKSGKSSFLKLLVKLQKVKEGVIQFGKLNINELKDSWVRSRIGYVAQKTALFGDTIRDAIKGNGSSGSDSDLINICRMVNVHSYIMSLQQGYDSPLNSDLSDEVKEKLAIARILMNSPDVLILDNCMNNINLFTQMAIITEFLSLHQKTAIVTTSKLDIIKTSDLILYFKDGELEIGTFSQLVSESAKFRSIVERAELDKTITDFESGVPDMKTRSNRTFSRSNIGLSTSEMIANEVVALSRFLKNIKKSEQKDFDEKKDEIKTKKKINCWKTLTLNRREFPYLTTAAIAATIMGFSIPAYATLFGESLGTIVLSSKHEIEENINFFPQMFLVAGLISGIAKMVEGYMIAVACSKLTKRLRKQTFEALIHKDMAFYDKEENHLSAILTLLREDARIVPLAAGPEMVLFIKVGGIIIISTLVSVYHSWKLGLVVLGFSPFLFYGLYYLSRFQGSGVFENKYSQANETLNLVDRYMTHYQDLLKARRPSCIGSMRTKAVLFGYSQSVPYFAYAVCMLYGGLLLQDDEFFKNLLKHAETLQTLNLVDHYMTHYQDLLKARRPSCIGSMRTKAVLFGYSQSVPYFAYAVCMLYGGLLLQDDEITFTNFFKVLESLILGTVLLSQVLMVIPNRRPCLRSCAKLLELIPSRSERAHSLTRSRFELGNYITIGYVKMKHISFVHPYNNLVPRLYDINLQINERQTVIALTGFLNSGSSLLIKLLNQFYKPTSGSIVIDEFDINREFSLKTLRRNVGLVDGKDRFFRRTVARNISYSVNNSRDIIETYVGMDDIVAVAKEADIHNFIITLPEGYYTIMTEEVRKKMTPGQVLRLSLARALLRDPRLLLFENIGVEIDEDAQTLMETAIMKASFSRTVLLSSSYLQSVSNIADFIYFFENGYIKEFGKHQKLMEKQGSYYKLYELQREQLNRMRESRLMGFEED